MSEVVLSLNAGSSSLKFALFAAEGDALAEGAVERVGDTGGKAWIRRGGDRREIARDFADHAAALATARAMLAEAGVPAPTVVGHRVVHGGPRLVEPTFVDAAVLAELEAVVPLAPLHLPASIAAIRAVGAEPAAPPQIACFDTAFHARLPELARRLPLPARFDDAGVRRYGFHGLSYELVMSVLGAAAPARLVIAHLGNGASLAAVRDGSPIDTTMGLTPTGGVPMGTRTGDLDPGVIFYMQRAFGLDVDAIERVIDRESGLVGIAGSSDMKTLLARSDARAELAVATFSYGVKKAIGAFAAALGGIDMLVFTGGIGEHAHQIRARVCEGLDVVGIRLDRARNESGEGIVSAEASRCIVRVVATDEDRMIAQHCRALMSKR
ncbi:MAG TPA: acetate/propionate family kinase [Labilithrix sp.]